MMRIKAMVLIAIGVLVGVLIGATWRGESAHAQSPRFRTERHGELLFIRYFNSVTGVECYLGMDATGLVSVPCDRKMNRP